MQLHSSDLGKDLSVIQMISLNLHLLPLLPGFTSLLLVSLSKIFPPVIKKIMNHP